jgi:hypothetical protein
MHVDAVEGLAFQGLAYFLSSLVFSAEVYTAKRLSGWLSEGWDRLGEVSLNDLGLCCTFTAHVLSFAFFAFFAFLSSLPFPFLPSCVTKPSLLSGVSFALAHVSGAACM